LVCGLLVTALASSGTVQAAERAAKGKGKKERPAKQKREKGRKEIRLGGQYEAMIKEAKLDDAQVAQLKKIITAQRAAEKAWQQDPSGGGKMKELQKAIKEAGDDKEKAKPLREQMRAIAKDRREARSKSLQDIEGLLKPEQKTAWEGYRLCRGLERSLRKAELTDDQKAKIRGMCDKAAEDMPADRKARAAHLKELKSAALALLTPEQVEKIKAKPEAKEKPEKKERRPKKAKPAKDNE